MKTKAVAFVAGMAASCSALAVQVIPVAYTMPNGVTGIYTYWDDSYTGVGCKTCDGAQLSGGLGDLTDGIVAAGNWSTVEAPAGPGPYVGWVSNPTISFHFGSIVSIDSLTIYADDSGGTGGVSPPASLTIGSNTYAVTDPPGTSPFSFTVSGLAFTGTDLAVVVNRGGPAVFISEITFQSPVPESGTGAMLAAGLGVIYSVVQRRRLTP